MSNIDKALSTLSSNDEVDLDTVSVDLDANHQVPHISTGSIVMDYLIGGNRLDNGEKQCPGIPRGMMTELFGKQGSGKTTVCIETAVQCQKEGGSICYLDYENAFNPAYASHLGLDVEGDQFQLLQPRHWEEGAEIIEAMVESRVDLIIIDSMAAMKPRDKVENDASDTGQIGHLARLQSDWLPQLATKVKQANTALIFTNQLRNRIKTSRYDTGPDEETTGGRAAKYYCSLRLKLSKSRTEYKKIEDGLEDKEKKQPISNIIRAKNVKTRLSKHQGHTAEFVIRYGEGVDNVRSIIEIGASRGVIQRSGSWYTFQNVEGEEVKKQGKENLREHLVSHPEDLQKLTNEIQAYSKGHGGEVEVDDDEEIVVEEEGS